MPPAVAKEIGPTEAPSDETEAIADALEIAFGKRPDPEQVEMFCSAVAMAMAKHEAGEY